MKFKKIFLLEFAYQFRSISTWLIFIVLLGLTFLFVLGNYIGDARDGKFLLNAPIIIAAITVFCSLLWSLIGASVAGNAASRDIQTKMHSLTYTTPVSKIEYLGGRFLAAFLLNVLILLAIPIGILFATHFTSVEAEILGPFRPAAYFSIYFYILLPIAFYATAIQFSFATISGRAMAGYLGGLILFFAAYLLGQILQNADGWGTLVDPIGFTPVLSNLTNEWTPIEKNTRLIELEGAFLMNRLIWLVISIGIFLFAYYRFNFVQPSFGNQKKCTTPESRSKIPKEWLEIPSSESLQRLQGNFNVTTYLRQMFVITAESFKQLAGNRVGIFLLALIAILVAVAMPGNLNINGVPMLLRTDQVLNYLTDPLTNPQSFWVIITLLIVFYAGELVWREREIGLSEIASVAPVSEWVLFSSRFVAIGLMLIVWLTFLMIAGVIVQTVIGGLDTEIELYMQAFFGFQLVEYLLFILLALVIHVLVNQKFIGHLVAILIYSLIAFAPNLGIDHKLLLFGSSPVWSYTSMEAFGNSLGPWLWFKSYWIAWALLLAVLAKLFWVRGREVSFTSRLSQVHHRFTRSTAIVTLIAIGWIFTSGGFIFYNTNVLNEYLSASKITELSAQYEQQYKKYDRIAQPNLISTNLHVEIYPEERKSIVQGTYILKNNNIISIDSVHVSTARGVKTEAISFDRQATRVHSNEDHGYHIYFLEKPLNPGDSIQLRFEVLVDASGFSNNGADNWVTSKTSNFRNYELLPVIGYKAYLEINDAGDRKKYILPSRPVIPSLYDKEARGYAPFSEQIFFNAVVGTDKNQVVVAPGTLQRSWTKGDRRYFHYATDVPIRNEYNFFSANYAVHKGKWKDVSIQIFYDPGETENLERMERSIQASLEYYGQEFGPYPHQALRFVSYPGFGIVNHAAPINITAEEGFFLMNPKDDPRDFDLVSAVVAHEVAHQWWGNQFRPASVEGSGLLTESLSWYSAMGVLEEKYGTDHLQKLLSFLREEYKKPQSRAALPLLQAGGFYQNYRKGPLALYALSEYIGRDQVNNALRHMYEKHKTVESSLPTSLDLYRELQLATPDSLQYLLHDLFEKNTFWELETEQVTAERLKEGAWQVSLDVQARKLVFDEMGNETDIPMNDWVEIGVFAPAKKGKVIGELLYLQKHRIGSFKERITVTVREKPARAGIDPNYLLMDLKTDDNISEVNLQHQK